jgi:hypothetical protein
LVAPGNVALPYRLFMKFSTYWVVSVTLPATYLTLTVEKGSDTMVSPMVRKGLPLGDRYMYVVGPVYV